MITVRVCYKQSGKAAKGIGVSVGFGGLFRGITRKEYTDSNGDVHFDSDPGEGAVYADGKTVYKGRIEGRIVVYI